jgi:catechol 2,3-dioxygenase-like lactoylglutathione lyase family enzyme
MEFRSNNCIAIHLKDLKKAESFYGGVLGFKLLSKSNEQLEYDTGHFLLYINKGSKTQPPIPSFTVKNFTDAKRLLKKNGCKITVEGKSSLYFKDPFGIVYDIIEG